MVNLIRQNLRNNKQIYKSIEKDLRKSLGDNIPIDHVGSTVIPYMYGKNIIDILIGASDNRQFNKIKTILLKKNYVASSRSKNDIYQFFASKEEETSSGDIHLHLVMLNTQRYNDFLILKSFLLNNKEEARKYSNLKKELIKNGIIDRERYKAEKSKYVSDLIERAREAYKDEK